MAGLPDVPGPKLMPFIPNGTPFELEFIKLLGSGEHGHVWKVSINGDIYALKMFRFDDRFTPTRWWEVVLPKEDQRLWQFAFNCECRAYARLKEVKKEFIAVPCYGYLILGEEHQKALRKKDKLNWKEDWGHSKKDRGQPLQALVKKFIEWQPVRNDDFEEGFNRRRIRLAIDSAATARKLIENMKILHRAGILCNDVNNSNVLNGQFLEFSSAFTAPHPCLSTKQIEARKCPFDSLGYWDASAVDEMIEDYNNVHTPSEYIWDRATPNEKYQAKLRSHQHPPGWKEGPWNWNRGYRFRPDKFRWENIGKTKEEDPVKTQESSSKQEKHKKKGKRKAKSKG
ncbi:hypothetical protein PFICI_00323 [Pestalotiopsis fici W106-1]|uniref:Protein kinase domain-containing protein n=1 Tax=Pestalotiopsis fici (strain W106-1 / CGMCC3.15140) TaxID=1229662 RepID=W3XKG3_PESFW|nr:uncharacterized protein PFICI_00323 [Pestalotiopsis fici W106-1]ETS86495.1 hypothetical protein PFICI_00323 [Pestalotiopsis fici W106-1]